MSFSADYLFVSMMFSIVGFAYFRYGKKRPSAVALGIGIVLRVGTC